LSLLGSTVQYLPTSSNLMTSLEDIPNAAI